MIHVWRFLVGIAALLLVVAVALAATVVPWAAWVLCTAKGLLCLTAAISFVGAAHEIGTGIIAAVKAKLARHRGVIR